MSSRLRPPIAFLSLLVAAPAIAQDASTYQLPPASTAAPAVQGPVVPEAPPPRPAVTPAPTVSAAPSPSPTNTVPPPSSAPAPERTAPPPRSQPTTSAVPEALPAPTASAPAAAQDPVFTQDLEPATPPAPPPPPAPPQVAEAAVPPRATSWVWPAALLAALALIAGTGAMLVLRRKTQKLPDAPFERPVVPAPATATPPAPALPRPQADVAPLDVALESLRMSASLVNATLAYRLSLTAQADTGPTEVRVQMTSAHASRSPEEQFAAAAEVPPSHRLAGLQAGQSTVLEGEIRLPLAAITPIRNGNFALFVPLVRIDAAAAMGDSSLDLRRAYVVGLDEGAPGARLQPFRLDLGPRVYPRIGQRELTLPAFS